MAGLRVTILALRCCGCGSSRRSAGRVAGPGVRSDLPNRPTASLKESHADQPDLPAQCHDHPGSLQPSRTAGLRAPAIRLSITLRDRLGAGAQSHQTAANGPQGRVPGLPLGALNRQGAMCLNAAESDVPARSTVV